MKKILFLALIMFIFSNIASADVGCVDLSKNLYLGMKDKSNVVLLQEFLKSKNYLNTNPTGFFGNQTHKAVRAFQKENNINPTGFVGLITRGKIKEVSCVEKIATPVEVILTPTIVPITETQIVSTPAVEDVILDVINNPLLKVRTDRVISVTSNSILVRGSITSGARSNTERWFELTKNPLVYKLSETTISSKIPQHTNNGFEQLFTDLTQNTSYYFRVCAQNTSLGQKSCGGTVSIITNSN